MNVRPKGNTGPAFPHSTPRGKRGLVPRGGKALLGAKDLELHEQMKKDGSLKSGRGGAYVYYVRKGRQRWRRYVVPRDPRTAAQQRSRAIFSAASKTWSADGALTDEQRDAWYAQGANKRSRWRFGFLSQVDRTAGFRRAQLCQGPAWTRSALQPAQAGDEAG